jgi:hypothetical protein
MWTQMANILLDLMRIEPIKASHEGERLQRTPRPGAHLIPRQSLFSAEKLLRQLVCCFNVYFQQATHSWEPRLQSERHISLYSKQIRMQMLNSLVYIAAG